MHRDFSHGVLLWAQEAKNVFIREVVLEFLFGCCVRKVIIIIHVCDTKIVIHLGNKGGNTATNFNVITLVEVFVCWICECGLVLEPRIFYVSHWDMKSTANTGCSTANILCIVLLSRVNVCGIIMLQWRSSYIVFRRIWFLWLDILTEVSVDFLYQTFRNMLG